MTNSLTPDAWQRIKTLASAVLDLEVSERAAYIERACAGDYRLRDEVLSLVGSADAAAPFFEIPGGGAAPGLYASAGRLGPYRLIRELASGGMGTVYLAERDDGEFRQRVAIKIVRGGFGNAFLLERFRAERRILASLEHPNIARLLDGGTTGGGLPYVVMEFVEGDPIDVFCSRRELPLRDRLVIFQQVCAAVQYAHQHLVIHRDIKPPNILVAADGIPKLLDFGIAKLLDADAEAAAHTIAHVMTPESASPEQVSGQPVGIATDFYALGVLLYRLLTGESPYRPALDRGIDLTHAICEEPVDRPSEHAAALRIPADVDMIVLKSLRKEPERRYASVEQLSSDVQRFLDGRPVLASPDSLRYRAGKFVGRHRVGVGAVLTLIIALTGGIAATVWQARIANRERAHAQYEFDAVRGLATAMLVEVTPAVEKLPGSTAVREIIIRRGTQYLDVLTTEASGDDQLRREVALGYLRLSDIQGGIGLPNVGDREAARRSLLKAASLLEPLVRRPAPAFVDRVRLAQAYSLLAEGRPPAVATKQLTDARSLVDGLTAAEQSTPEAITARQSVWAHTANLQIGQHDFEGARTSQEHFVDAAVEAMRQRPSDLAASRNLALAYKTLGATLEMLKRRPEALTLYNKALDLDEARVAAEPTQALWRLDLSFSYGAIGSALSANDDFEGARSKYEQAVALRERIVREDPNEDFAKVALGRGYDRLALVWAGLGRADTALDFSAKGRQVFRERLRAHPERDYTWSDFTTSAMHNVDDLLVLAPRSSAAGRQQIGLRAASILDELQDLKDRWAREKHAGELPPSIEQLHAERARVAALR
jgi:tetratricopeptide (TPR) repeat protein